jgi:hypothetical protein
MIQVTHTASEFGDTLVRSVHRTWMPADTFTMQDIDDGIVYIQPRLNPAMGSERETSMTIRGTDPSGSIIDAIIRFRVQHAFCPRLNNATVTLTTQAGVPVVLTGAIMGLYEAHGLSVWDIRWNTPTIQGGRLEYYCPDSRCEGPGWRMLPASGVLKHVIWVHVGLVYPQWSQMVYSGSTN